MFQQLLNLIKTHQYHLFLTICIGLISFISFNLGKINSNEKSFLKITEDANIYKAATSKEISNDPSPISPSTISGPSTKLTPKPLDLRVVVSKASDSKKYHYSFCNSWKKIKVENQLWFNSAEEAEKAGYTLAGNCSK